MPNHCGGATKSSMNVTSTFFNTVHLLRKDIRFKQGGTKLASCPRSHLTSLCRWFLSLTNSATKTLMSSKFFSACKLDFLIGLLFWFVVCDYARISLSCSLAALLLSLFSPTYWIKQVFRFCFLLSKPSKLYGMLLLVFVNASRTVFLRSVLFALIWFRYEDLKCKLQRQSLVTCPNA